MQLENYSVKKFKNKIINIIKKYPELKKSRVFVFGSRVRGDNFARADIDLGLESPNQISAIVKYKFEQEIKNLPLLYKIDLVDFNNVSSDFKKQALKNIEYVYPV